MRAEPVPELTVRATSDVLGLFDRRLQPSSCVRRGGGSGRLDSTAAAAPEGKTPIVEALTREMSTLQVEINAFETALGRTPANSKSAKARRAGLRSAAAQRRNVLGRVKRELREVRERPVGEF